MPTISSITARQILDSRGRPTVEATVSLSDGTVATSSVPSGSVSNEQNEALELRDHNSAEYFGYGVSKAVELINTEINQKLAGLDPLYQTKIDQTLVDLDGTKNKSRLGANSILAVSQAVMKAAAASLHLPLFVYVKEKYQLIEAYRIPTPIFNLINGGRHGGGTLDFQEFQLVPASHLPYEQALKIGTEMFMAVGQVLEQKGALTSVGLEGGYAPNLASNSDALEIFNEAAKVSSYTISKDAFLGIDLGPQNFYKSGKYTIKDKSQPMSGKDFVKYLKGLHEQYRVFALEDPLVADAWGDWKFITAELGQTAMILADDLVATNKTLLMKAIEEKACNALVIKPNRVGTITETIEIASIAKKAGWHTVMSHRSSETTDDVLADVAVGIGTDYVKFGAPSRGERVVKYNRLLRIEEILRASSGQTTNTPERTTMSPTQTSAPQPAVTPEPAQTIPTVAPTPQPTPAVPPMVTPAPAPMAPATPPAPFTTPSAPPFPQQPVSPPVSIPPMAVTPPVPTMADSQEVGAPAVHLAPVSPSTPITDQNLSVMSSGTPTGIATPTPLAHQPSTVPVAEQPAEPTLELNVSVPTQTPQASVAPAEVFAPEPPSTLPQSPQSEGSLEPETNEEGIQDSLNELVQMVDSVPLEEQTTTPASAEQTTPPATVALNDFPAEPTTAPVYSGTAIPAEPSQPVLSPTAAPPSVSPPTIQAMPEPALTMSQPTFSGLPKPTPPSFSQVASPTIPTEPAPTQENGTDQSSGLQPPIRP